MSRLYLHQTRYAETAPGAAQRQVLNCRQKVAFCFSATSTTPETLITKQLPALSKVEGRQSLLNSKLKAIPACPELVEGPALLPSPVLLALHSPRRLGRSGERPVVSEAEPSRMGRGLLPMAQVAQNSTERHGSAAAFSRPLDRLVQSSFKSHEAEIVQLSL
jgi:hypothetical protein